MLAASREPYCVPQYAMGQNSIPQSIAATTFARPFDRLRQEKLKAFQDSMTVAAKSAGLLHVSA